MLCLLHRLPASRKRGSSRCVLHLLMLNTVPLRSKLAAKALLPSPAQPGGIASQKPANAAKPPWQPDCCDGGFILSDGRGQGRTAGRCSLHAAAGKFPAACPLQAFCPAELHGPFAGPPKGMDAAARTSPRSGNSSLPCPAPPKARKEGRRYGRGCAPHSLPLRNISHASAAARPLQAFCPAELHGPFAGLQRNGRRRAHLTTQRKFFPARPRQRPGKKGAGMAGAVRLTACPCGTSAMPAQWKGRRPAG